MDDCVTVQGKLNVLGSDIYAERNQASFGGFFFGGAYSADTIRTSLVATCFVGVSSCRQIYLAYN